MQAPPRGWHVGLPGTASQHVKYRETRARWRSSVVSLKFSVIGAYCQASECRVRAPSLRFRGSVTHQTPGSGRPRGCRHPSPGGPPGHRHQGAAAPSARGASAGGGPDPVPRSPHTLAEPRGTGLRERGGLAQREVQGWRKGLQRPCPQTRLLPETPPEPHRGSPPARPGRLPGPGHSSWGPAACACCPCLWGVGDAPTHLLKGPRAPQPRALSQPPALAVRRWVLWEAEGAVLAHPPPLTPHPPPTEPALRPGSRPAPHDQCRLLPICTLHRALPTPGCPTGCLSQPRL